ncbi:MAG TPA: 6-phosphogluconolactonase [Gaiellales bacterium]|nr:6-phosphogluconolactonase [Gaiellales bacterium]
MADAVQLAVVSDPEEASVRAAAALAAAARAGGSISLAGSNTPRRSYELLAAEPGIDWSQVHIWFGDERCVPPDDSDSNYRMAEETLISRIDIPAANVHRIRGEDDPDAAAAAYADEIAGVSLDLALLGLGPDGHTASLFPDSPALDVRDRLAVPVVASKPPPRRITLTFPVFERASAVLVLAPGESKADAIAAVLRGPDPHYPASLLPAGRTTILTDTAGAP